MASAPTPTPLDDTSADEPRHRHLVDALVRDPTGIPPLCGESQFAAIVEGMVADAAPRLFAVVQEYGDRVDAAIAAWGIAFADHAEVVAVDHGPQMSLGTPDDALRAFQFGSHIRARLVWFNPDAITPAEDDADG